MTNTEALYVFKYNHRVLHINLEGITHEDSLLSPVNGAACINWVVGHLLVSRDDVYELFGINKKSGSRYYELYDRGTKGNHINEPFILDDLLKSFDESQNIIVESINKPDFTQDIKILEKLSFYSFHEAYHVGQIGLLRRMIGKEGAIK